MATKFTIIYFSLLFALVFLRTLLTIRFQNFPVGICPRDLDEKIPNSG